MANFTAQSRQRNLLATVSLGLLLALVAACGESANSGGTTDAAVVEAAQASVDKSKQGTDRPLPESGPAPLADQNIWVVSCLEALEGCAVPADGVKEAGEALGWDVSVVDGKGTPDAFAKAIRGAVADKADAVVLVAIDCVAAKGALEEAHRAGVKVYGIYSFDCNDPLLEEPGEPLFDAEINYGGNTYGEQVEDEYSKSVADYVIAATDGRAKIIQFIQDDILVGQHLYKGFSKHIEKCAGCEIVKQVPFTLNDIATGQLQSKASAALVQNPDADVVYVPYDAALINGIAQAVTASGRDSEVLVTGGEGLSSNMAFLEEGKGQDLVAGAPARRVGWAAVDGLNRLLQGEPQADAGIGHQTLDSTTPLPTNSTYYDGNIDSDGTLKQDYVAIYRSVWGLG